MIVGDTMKARSLRSVLAVLAIVLVSLAGNLSRLPVGAPSVAHAASHISSISHSVPSGYCPLVLGSIADAPCVPITCDAQAVQYASSVWSGVAFTCFQAVGGDIFPAYAPTGLTCQGFSSQTGVWPFLVNTGEWVCQNPVAPTPVPAASSEQDCRSIGANLIRYCGDFSNGAWLINSSCAYYGGLTLFPSAPSFYVSQNAGECAYGGAYYQNISVPYTGVSRVFALHLRANRFSTSGTLTIELHDASGCGGSPAETYSIANGANQVIDITLVDASSSATLCVDVYNLTGANADVGNMSMVCQSGCYAPSLTPTPGSPPVAPTPNPTQAYGTAIAMATAVATYFPATPQPLPTSTPIISNSAQSAACSGGDWESEITCDVSAMIVSLVVPSACGCVQQDLQPVENAANAKYPCCDLSAWPTVFPSSVATPNACAGGGNPASVSTPGGDLGISISQMMPSFNQTTTPVPFIWDFCPTAEAVQSPPLAKVDSYFPMGRAFLLVGLAISVALWQLTFVRSWYRNGHSSANQDDVQ